MATFYHGYRAVIKGRNSKDSVHPYKGVGEYSNWELHNTSHALDGAPDENHVPGTGRHPHGLHLSRIFRGLEDRTQPLVDPGNGPRLEDHRWGPLLNKSAGNNRVFKDDYGHAPGTPVDGEEQYGVTDWIYDGVTEKPLSGTFGHKLRGVDAEGTANTFGRFDPLNYASRAVNGTPLEDVGNETVFELDDNSTAHKKTLEWRGIPSAQALNI